MNYIKKIINYFIYLMKLLWSIIAYIPTFFIRALTVIIICIFILSLFSKVSDDIEKGTALFIPMNGILVEQAQEVNSFESFLGGARKSEIELKNIIIDFMPIIFSFIFWYHNHAHCTFTHCIIDLQVFFLVHHLK